MQAGVPLLDPRTRCFSELPQWLEAQAPQLRDKRVLMYCTGGVRCERASAYLTELGVTDVYQLQGELFVAYCVPAAMHSRAFHTSLVPGYGAYIPPPPIPTSLRAQASPGNPG